jgi:C1A family cysteine protease
MEKKYSLGLIKDKKDDRDVLYKAHRGRNPKSTDRKNILISPYIYDQKDIGSCVGNGVVKAFRHVLKINEQPDFDASRLFAYWIAREDKLNDTGASIRDAFKAMNKNGLCSEKLHPYITKNFSKTPSEEAFLEALDHQSIRYERLIQTKFSIQDAVSHGYPVVYGKLLFESFMSDQTAKTGIVPFPDVRREEFYGGHCMAIFDYDELGTVEVNSWGKEWGQDGTCHVPWEYVLNPQLAFDFWVLYLSE